MTSLFPPNRKAVVVHRLCQLEQVKQMKSNETKSCLRLKRQLRPGEACSPVNYEVPSLKSETQALSTRTRLQVHRGYITLRFYIERDVTIWFYVRTLRTEWREGL